jgi:hypothetical protein
VLADLVRDPHEEPVTRVVADEHARREALDAYRSRSYGKALDQNPSDPMALPEIGDHECDLRLRGVLGIASEASDTQAIAGGGVERDESLVLLMVDVGEVGELPLAEVVDLGEKAAVAGDALRCSKPVLSCWAS